MYKLNKINTLVRFVKSKIFWFRRKVILILTAFMIGISNGMYEQKDSITGYQPEIEQQDKDD